MSRIVATVGSVVIPASMEPCWSAATKVGPAPTATGVNSLTLTPFLTARYLVRKSVEEPRPVTPSFLPLKSLADLTFPAALVETTSTSPGACENCTTDSTDLPLTCRSSVWS